MEKAPRNPLEMSMEEWEFLPDNTPFLEFGLEDVKDLLSNEIIYTDYFREEPKLIQQQQQLNEKSPAEILSNEDHEEAQLIKDISFSHVFFKLKPMGSEEELMDMKASSSPKHCAVELVAAPQLTQPPPAFILEFGKGGEVEEKISAVQEEEEKPVWEGRRRLTCVGALCSIGVAAAATICILLLGGRRQMQPRRHVLRFHIHADDKGLTQVVEQASRLNRALAAARGAPTMMRRADISFGGYYDGL